MRIVCFSQAKYYKDEHERLTQLFHAGLHILHIRKQDKSKGKLKHLISKIPEAYHSRIVLHDNFWLSYKFNLKGIHLTRKHRAKWFRTLFFVKVLKFLKPKLTLSCSLHHLSELNERFFYDYNYVFLSPVFDSISKKGHMAAFKKKDVKLALQKKKHKVYALGGITEKTIIEADQMGFDGVGVLGGLWKSKQQDYLEVFKRLKEAKNQLALFD